MASLHGNTISRENHQVELCPIFKRSDKGWTKVRMDQLKKRDIFIKQDDPNIWIATEDGKSDDTAGGIIEAHTISMNVLLF
jgi:hypothetical protein